jgi:hypothetical protein
MLVFRIRCLKAIKKTLLLLFKDPGNPSICISQQLLWLSQQNKCPGAPKFYF